VGRSEIKFATVLRVSSRGTVGAVVEGVVATGEDDDDALDGKTEGHFDVSTVQIEADGVHSTDNPADSTACVNAL